MADGRGETPGDTAHATAGVDAGTIVGLLADADRRRVFAAIELGAGTLEAAIAATGLPDFRVAKALGKLVDAGLVTASGGPVAVDGDAIARAARRGAAAATQHGARSRAAGDPQGARRVRT